MPRTNIPVTALDPDGVAPPAQTDGDATNDHSFTNDGRTFLEVVSSDAGAQTVAIVTAAEFDATYAVEDVSVAVPAGATRLCGPFDRRTFNQTDGTVHVDPSVSTTLKFRAYRI